MLMQVTGAIMAASFWAREDATATELGLVVDMSTAFTFFSFSKITASLRRVLAVGGGLEKLGLVAGSPTAIRKHNRRILNRWKAALLAPAVLFLLIGVLSVFTAVLLVGTRSRLTGRIITPGYALTLLMISPCFGGWIPLVSKPRTIVASCSKK